ncbi:imelysin family protein [Comamonas composti]|uniref:imelysin family protein n=1 Tax=Comamonas composti TaxID=408558 RepID=UPI000478B87A|nr:imelysin family protein [Comamonas composti]
MPGFSMYRQALPAAALSLLAATWAQAQDVPANMAIPFYNTTHAVHGLYAKWFAPGASQALGSAKALSLAVSAYCAADPGKADGPLLAARQAFLASSTDWSRLSAVALGPLVDRRSARQVDFRPLRPALLKKAVQSAPADLAAMERIGAPAKGYPALEYLLWTQPAAPRTPSCAYGVLVAQEVAGEMQALEKGFAELAAQDWGEDGEATTEAMAEFINQWVGGLERLRWAEMEKPLRSAGSKPPAWEHGPSAGAIAVWRAQWQGLRQLAVSVDRSVPAAGSDLVPIEAYLRGRGLNPLADRWLKAVNEAEAAMAGLAVLGPAEVEAATKPLSRLKRLMEAEVAPALEVNIGFSDADGD